ncbi:MAG: alginate O-acetyltransferase AlgX-related protein [Vicinamibacterales bacterium]
MTIDEAPIVAAREPESGRASLRSALRLSTGRLMPALLVAIGLADVVTRALPIDAFAFRAWEAMLFNRPDDVAFEPHARFDRWTHGDLANIGNLPAHRVYRRETWTIDAYGFRNPPALAASGRVQALLLGDSFGAGSGMADQDTISAQLTERGVPTYNVAPAHLTPHAIQVMATRLGMHHGWVLVQKAAGLRYAYVEPPDFDVVPEARAPVTSWDRFKRNVSRSTWPLRIVAERWLKRWQDDRWFPNPYNRIVEVRRLANRDTMLFFAGEKLEAPLPAHALQSIDDTVRVFRELHEALRATSLRFAVMLVPDRFGVYAHLIPDSGWPGGQSPYLEELDRRLQAAGVPTINLHDAMAERATVEAKAFRYLYWRDDTHWNGLGTAVAADVVAAYVSSMARDEP